MRFTPLTEEELAVAHLLPKGQYPFTVLKSEDKISQAGNEIISLKLGVRGSDDKVRYVFCNLLSAMPHLVKHFCDTTGQPDKYSNGSLHASDCDGKKGFVDIEIEEYENKFKQKAMKNVVKDFVVQVSSDPFGDTDITF